MHPALNKNLFLVKEHVGLFSADNYILEISDSVPADHPIRLLIMAAVMCIDMVLKE